MTLLTLRDVIATYGASPALFGVSFTVDAGEIVALMGRNGMGKSTTVKCICRMMPCQGTLIFADKNLAHLSSAHVGQAGIGLVPEGRRCFSNLSVYENLVVAARPGPWHLQKVIDLLPRLGERLRQGATTLSGGEQQMLAIGRALMTNPRLLILDEATEGLAPNIRQEIWQALDHLKSETGLAILVIDKSIRELSMICDKAVIMVRGRTVWKGQFSDVSAEISERYLGV